MIDTKEHRRKSRSLSRPAVQFRRTRHESLEGRSQGENGMKKVITYLMSILFVALPVLSAPALAADQEKDEDRLKNSGIVLKEAAAACAVPWKPP